MLAGGTQQLTSNTAFQSTMQDPGKTELKPSRLVELPLELQGMIFEDVNNFDLNRLCLTCKTIKAVVLPKLYHQVVIRVPQKWSRLPSLEGLLGSTGDGLKYTKYLFIATQQYPLRDSQQEFEDSRRPEEVLAETKLQFYLPQSSASNALNAQIRILIRKLPLNQLEEFRWGHSCELNVSTLDLLFETQQANLGSLFCNRLSSSCDVLGSVIEGIDRLSVESMDLNRGGCQWAASMLVKNAETLDHLELGFKNRIAHDFALNRRPQYDKMWASFGVDVGKTLSAIGLEPPVNLSLESVYLCGLDFRTVIQGMMALHIDFNNVIELRLESCPGLSQAFSLLMGQGDSSRLALGALRNLFVRLEDPDPNLFTSLESFLTSVRGLNHLQVLIDKTLAVQNLEPILKVHGKTLETLVWDERRGPRTQLNASTSLLSSKLGNLRVISQNCPSLTLLGIPLNWEAISSSDKYFHESIARLLRKMPYLKVLNIRNLPEISGRSAMPMDYFVKGLAAMFVDIVNKKRKSTLLKTVAIGAPLYRDVYIGTHHVVHTAVSDFLRFRIYNIDYDYPSPSGLSPVLSKICKGAASSSEDEFCHSHLLHNYWLG